MARLGIVIAVSENEAPISSLKACANDAKAISDVLSESKRFDDIIVLSTKEDTRSENVKSRLTSFMDKYRGTAVEEIVFYYSGHGDFEGDEFYFILSDYTAKARHRTSLTNAELDTMIRALSPSLFVKIVDACYSGLSYVKSDDALQEYLKSTQIGFRDVYFLYSSQLDETSSTKGSLSAFTTSILEAIATQTSGNIRYRDLMSAASDYFEANGGQTPQFVTQAPFTEIFCEASPIMQSVVQKYLPNNLGSKTADPNLDTKIPSPSKGMTIGQRIIEADKKYCSKDEANKILNLFLETIMSNTLDRDLPDLFDLSVSKSDEEPSGVSAIGEWLQGQADREFFAIPTLRKENYKRRVPKRNANSGIIPNITNRSYFARLLPSYLDSLPDEEVRLVDAVRNVVTGYKNTASLPFASATVKLSSRFKLLAPEECVVIPIVSLTTVRMYWRFRRYKHTDWESVEPTGVQSAWSNFETALKDEEAIIAVAKRIGKELNDFVIKGLEARWPNVAPLFNDPTVGEADAIANSSPTSSPNPAPAANRGVSKTAGK